jgi:perosamine synthetase
MRIPLAVPSIGPLEEQYVADAIATGWISGTGPYVAAFEAALQVRLDRSSVTAISSGTQALEITLQALGIGPGDEVIVPALTFAAPAAAVKTMGAAPVLADVTEATWTIDPSEVAELITSRTKAIIAVDVIGHPCAYKDLECLGLPIIEDAAEAHGSLYMGSLTGKFGLASIFSFHANKTITTGEGGCIATDDEDLSKKIRLIANHGMTACRPYYHEVAGRNGRMTNLSAAVGVAQMQRWDELVSRRRRVGLSYSNYLTAANYSARPQADWALITPWLATVLLADRDRTVMAMRNSGVDARAIWPALSDLALYRSGVRRPCPAASYISAHAAWLPTWSHMDDGSISDVVRTLELAS